MRHNGSLEWLHQNRLQEPVERRLVKSFERRYKRPNSLKGATVEYYGSMIEGAKQMCVGSVKSESSRGSEDEVNFI